MDWVSCLVLLFFRHGIHCGVAHAAVISASAQFIGCQEVTASCGRTIACWSTMWRKRHANNEICGWAKGESCQQDVGQASSPGGCRAERVDAIGPSANRNLDI